MKKLFLIIPCLIILVIFIVLYQNNKAIDYIREISINIGDNIPKSNDYIKKTNIDIIWSDNNKINYHSGKYNGTIKYKNNEYKVILNVIDSEKPTIKGAKDIEIYEKENVDLFKNILIEDNSLDELKKQIIGNYDINKKGEYNLKYKIKDKANNVTEQSFKLIVKEKKVIQKNNNKVISGTTSKGYEVKNVKGLYYINGILVANKTYKLPSTYNPGVLLQEFNIAFSNMKLAAKKDGVDIYVVSGFRSYNTQNTLYNRYVSRDGKTAADTYSARAGHSEHQTGLAADLNMVDTSFENTKAGIWLAKNCYKYGFILRYPKGKQSITGYIYEPWHFRYIGDEAKNLYNNGNWISLEEYLGIDSKY